MPASVSTVVASDSTSADENDGLLGGAVGGVIEAVDAPLGADRRRNRRHPFRCHRFLRPPRMRSVSGADGRFAGDYY